MNEAATTCTGKFRDRQCGAVAITLMRQFSILLILFLLSASCRQINSAKTIDKQGNSKHSSSYFSKKPTKYYFQFDTSKGDIENIDNGYVDTFSIRGIQFKLFSNPDSLGDLELQVLKNSSWQSNLKIPYGTNGHSIDTDINQDGNNDFQNSLLRGSQVYLFDTNQMKFHSEPISLAFEWTIIDSLQKLYCNNYEINGISETDLFKLDGLTQTFLYNAPITYEISANKEIATVRLYKVKNNDFSDTFFISQKKYDLLKSEFDYKKYWLALIREKGYR
jgi:hypothetical protein